MALTDSKVIESALRNLPSRPLLSPEENANFFTDFHDQMIRLRRAIVIGENSVILGDRGSGKSSLLTHLYYELKEGNEFIPIRINILGIDTLNLTSLLKSILYELFRATERLFDDDESRSKLVRIFESGSELEGKFPFALDIEPANESAYALLDKLTKAVSFLKENGHLTVCIMLDDVDKTDGRLVWAALRGARDALWKLRMPILVTASPRALTKLTEPPLDQFFPYVVTLPPFDEASAREMIEKRLAKSEIQIRLSHRTIIEIVRHSGGNPRLMLTQLRYALESGSIGKVITPKDFRDIWKPSDVQLTTTQRAVLAYVASHPGTSASSTEFRKSIGLGRARLAQVLNSLRRRGLVTANYQDRKMLYSAYERVQKNTS